MKITDNAYLVSQKGDTSFYQHASTLQLFQTVEQLDGKLELLIMHSGTWFSEGVYTQNQVAYQAANPQ